MPCSRALPGKAIRGDPIRAGTLPAVGLALPVVWSDQHRMHDPGGEIWVGVRTRGTELPERAEAIRADLSAAGARFVEAERQPDEVLHTVHDAALTAYLARAWEDWKAAGLTEDPGQDRVVPYLFPHPSLFSGFASAAATAMSARAGQFAYDTMTLIGPGTWEAARAALDTALTATDLVLAGEPLAYACCRPPGHHATRSAFGGSCYLNNSAAAAARLRQAIGRRVAVVDIDAHHGNGTQAIFWDDTQVITGSVHVDPGAGWFPHYLGFAGETGSGGTNRNLPLPPGTGDEGWLAAVDELTAWVEAGGAQALVVALGVDAGAGDPESPLEVSANGYRAAGRALGALGLPTVVLQEGGYELATIGGLVREALEGLEEGIVG
jgi:acetoin utilization deacetylase AcuC-like enzyme